MNISLVALSLCNDFEVQLWRLKMIDNCEKWLFNDGTTCDKSCSQKLAFLLKTFKGAWIQREGAKIKENLVIYCLVLFSVFHWAVARNQPFCLAWERFFDITNSFLHPVWKDIFLSRQLVKMKYTIICLSFYCFILLSFYLSISPAYQNMIYNYFVIVL